MNQFDDFANLDVKLVCKAASTIATSIADLQEFPEKRALFANCSYVEELLYCFTTDYKCPLFSKIFHSEFGIVVSKNIEYWYH